MPQQTEHLNLVIPTDELFERLAAEPRPMGLRAGKLRKMLLRETYFDSLIWLLNSMLSIRGIQCFNSQ